MAERIVKLIVMGITNYEAHMNPEDRIQIEESESLVTINIRNSAWVDPSAPQLELEGEDVAEEAVLVSSDEVTVEELKGLLRDKGLAVSGAKAELIARLNEAE